MALTKLPMRCNIKGGVIDSVTLISTVEQTVTQGSALTPAQYRTALGNGAKKEEDIARATISGPGASTVGKLVTRTPADGTSEIIQKYVASDGEWRRISTSDTVWGSWRKQFDELNKPAVQTDVTATTANSNETVFTVTSTSSDANTGPFLTLYRNSVSPAVGDKLGRITFTGRLDTVTDVHYAGIRGQIVDPSFPLGYGKIVVDVFNNGAGIDIAAFQQGFIVGATMTDQGIGTVNVSGAYYVDDVMVVGNRDTGWTAWTGTASKATRATTTATTEQNAQAIKAIIDALIAHGIIGA